MTGHPDGPPGFRGRFHRDPDVLAEHGRASGILAALPAAVAVPTDSADVAVLVSWAAERRIPLVARGAATGMPGGNVGTGVAVDLRSGLRRVVHIDPAARTAIVEPGVTLAELNAATAPFGLHLPVDPSSGERCTLGGMIANNAAGAHSVRYGATRPWVRALDVVLATGEIASVRRGATPERPISAVGEAIRSKLEPHRTRVLAGWPEVRKNSSGYALREYLERGDLLDLLVGAEGTLALIVGAELSLAPLPRFRGLALLEFDRLEDVGRAVPRILTTAPATCELLDRTFLDLIRGDGTPLPHPVAPGTEGVLLVEAEGDTLAEVEDRLAGVRAAVAGLAARTTLAADPRDQDRLWKLRHAASPIIARRAGGRVPMQFIEDGVVPVHRLPEYIRGLRAVLGRHGLPAVIFGHAGDGNLHVNPLVDVGAAGWRATVESVLEEVTEIVVALGGTMAGEHGDGRLRAPLLERVWGPEITALFRDVKAIFDPNGILNPGVILPLPDQRPLDALRTYG
jgi:FAD/FMN-containing dehydrogenase